MGINFSEVNFSYYIPRKKQNIRFILKDINLNIEKTGEFIALVGHTGSGKSTLAQHMNALITPTSGKLDILGSVINKNTKLKPIRKKVGLVFQFPEYQIFEDTVKKDIMFGPKNFNVEEAEERIEEISKKLDIIDLLDRSPFTLSGGQLRKVAIAGIIASNPDILILDEPTVGLDPFTKIELLEFLKDLNERYNKTIVIITHDMEVVSKYIKRVIVLNQGRIVYDGDKKSLFADDNILEKYNLDYPETILILKELKKRLNINIDPNQHSIEDAYNAILKAYGETNE
ncbi:MAG: ATP-binding cassette domain-containing protein [Bacilli bacterium]|nr:ATP-binding cassette domain-containing protein [Bacilli bacterium]